MATGGWEAAQLYNGSDSGGEGPTTGPALWHSTDGLHWKQTAAAVPVLEATCEAANLDPDVDSWDATTFRGIADASGRRVVTVTCPAGNQLVIATSTDGRQFEVVGAAGGALRGAMFDGLAGSGSAPWLFPGSQYGEGGLADQARPVIWSASDLNAWTATVLPIPTDAFGWWSALAIAPTTIGYVATGRSADDQTITWVSDDGLDWRVAAFDPVPWKACITAIALGRAATLGFGAMPLSDEVFQLGVWRLTRPE